MNISVNAAYKVAMITGSEALSVEALRHNIKVISAALCKQGVKPFDQVIVMVADEKDLLPVLWALRERKITAIPISPVAKDVDLVSLASMYGVKYVLTEEMYIPAMGPLTVMAVDTLLRENSQKLCSGSCTGHAPHDRDEYIFLTEHQEGQAVEKVDGTGLRQYFEQLDIAFSPSDADVLLLSGCIPYSKFVMDCLWACTRGITVVVAALNDPLVWEQYAGGQDNFKMEFGLFHFGSYIESATTNKYRSLFDTVQFADNNGFSSVWTPERHFNEFGGLFPNPSVLSAALAVLTTQVQIRCGSIVSPLHHPVRIAEDWSLIDNLSNGRVAISFASGWQCDDFVFAPQNYPERHNYMLQQIDAVRRLWRGEKLPFKNGLNKEIEIGIYPKPVQQELPFWITVSGRTETFVDAGKIGANILTHLLWQDMDELIEKIAAYRRSLQDNGFGPHDRKVAVMVHTCLGPDNGSVKEKVRKPLKEYIKASTQLIQAMAKSNKQEAGAKDIVGRYGDLDTEIPAHLMDEMVDIAFDRFFEQAALLGTIEKAKNTIRKLRSYDIDEVACLIDFGLAHEDIMEGLDYLKQLKEVYNNDPVLRSPVTITHCSLDTFHRSATHTGMSDLFRRQKKVLVEEGAPVLEQVSFNTTLSTEF